MSVTITIEGNNDYCKARGMIGSRSYDCQCVDFAEDGRPDPHCFSCKGFGSVVFEERPFEMNVANGNFRTLFSTLALPFDEECLSGHLDARTINAAIRSAAVELLERETRDEQKPGGPRVIHCGIDREQATHYLIALKEIADEAERRESAVVWC